MSAKLGVTELSLLAIKAVHRLHIREGKTAPILAGFTERKTRNMWVQKKVALKMEGIFINENLTEKQQALF